MSKTHSESEEKTCSRSLLTGSKINPYLECVIETNPDALEHARVLDDERLKGRVKGPLHGVPVLVKDVGHLDPPLRVPWHPILGRF